MIFVPVFYRAFPFTFLIGIFLMSAIFSIVQLLLRHSTTWKYGFYFCALYAAVLNFLTVVGTLSYYKSSWGTRMTSDDVREVMEQEEKQKK